MKNSQKTDENVSVPAEEAHCFHFMAPPNNDILISLLPDGTISAANEEFAKFVHRPSKEILQKNISTLVNAAPSKIIVHLLQQVQSPLSQATLFEESVFSDHINHWIQWVSQPVLGKDKKVATIKTVGRDITT